MTEVEWLHRVIRPLSVRATARPVTFYDAERDRWWMTPFTHTQMMGNFDTINDLVDEYKAGYPWPATSTSTP